MREKILGFIASLFIRLLGLTFRYKLVFKHEKDKEMFFKAIKRKSLDQNSPILLAFFHQDELALIPYFQNKYFSVLVSHSKDGEIMTNAIKRLGIEAVRGSSSRGAVAGLIASIKKVKDGYNFALAVDGPKGPIYEVKEGICAIQKKTMIPIAPIRAHVSRAYIFEKAWNKAKLPYPFAKIEIHIAQIASDYTTESLQKSLKTL